MFSLVDEITFTAAADAKDSATASAILGPFFRHDAPHLKNESSIVQDKPDDGEIAYMHGTVTDLKTKKPVAGAAIDVWQASTNGLYEQQDPNQRDCNLRGKFFSDENGHYGFYCLRPTPYPVPDDGMNSFMNDLWMQSSNYHRSRREITGTAGQTSIPTSTYSFDSKLH